VGGGGGLAKREMVIGDGLDLRVRKNLVLGDYNKSVFLI
jgi:hypothetical protein